MSTLRVRLFISVHTDPKKEWTQIMRSRSSVPFAMFVKAFLAFVRLSLRYILAPHDLKIIVWQLYSVAMATQA